MKIANKRAYFNYVIGEKIEAGIVLTGAEAKAIRTGHLNLSNAYGKIINREAYLINANIPVIQPKPDYNPTRARKLLLNRREINQMETKMKQGKLTFVPVVVYTKGHLVKVELGLAKSKREFEKKQTIKLHDIKRDLDRELK